MWPNFSQKEQALPGYIFIAFLIGVLYLFYLIIRPFLNDIFISILIALVFYPVFTRLTRWFRGRAIPAALITVLLVILLFIVPIALLSGVITTQSFELYQSLSRGLEGKSLAALLDVQIDLLHRMLDRLGLRNYDIDVWRYIETALASISDFIYREMTILAKGFIGVLLDIIIVLFISFFLLADGENFLREISAVSPLEDAHHQRIISQLERTVKATLKGSVIVALVQGTLGGIGFWIFGIPSAAFWGVCMLLSSVIPLVGTALIWVPAALYLALASSFWMGLGLALWGTLIIAGADNILRPILLKGEVNLHPLLTFLSVLGGLMYFGFLGFILGPVVLSSLMTLLDIYKKDFLKGKTSSM
ncbi:MAG: AI-2E family transporter [Deltaproteobacteria bacterium]|nr:AI-2E family transporter [Deltaproteobacteria bacterium]